MGSFPGLSRFHFYHGSLVGVSHCVSAARLLVVPQFGGFRRGYHSTIYSVERHHNVSTTGIMLMLQAGEGSLLVWGVVGAVGQLMSWRLWILFVGLGGRDVRVHRTSLGHDGRGKLLPAGGSSPRRPRSNLTY